MKPVGFKIINNDAYLNGYKLEDLAKKYTTPLYLVDEFSVREAISDYQKYFRGQNFKSTIVYASKAFLVPKMAQIINEYNLYMDAVSMGDLYVALNANFPANHLVFHGNNKSKEELIFAIENKIGLIVVDNYYELKNLIQLCEERKIVQNILFRVNPGIDAHTHQYIQTAKFTSKFGESIYDEKTIDNIMKTITTTKSLNLLGFHAHIGSQIHEMEAFKMEIDKMIKFQMEIASKYKYSLPLLNLGGGFGIKYEYQEKSLSIKDMMSGLSQKLDEMLVSNNMIKEVMIEPGRSIIGPAGITLYECAQIKKTYGGKNYLFVNGGMTDNIRPALYHAVYECDIVNKMNNQKEILVDVVGKCCESGDIIRHNVLVPHIDSGDIMVVYATGAYNYSMSSNYNNLFKPAVVLLGEKPIIISRKENINDLTRLFK